jgi:hypothetical protein
MHAPWKMLLGAAAIGVMTTARADAGLRGDWPLTIDPVNRAAFGSPAQARAGTGTTQYIGCWDGVSGIDDNSAGGDGTFQGGCAASDVNNVSVSCNFPSVTTATSRELLYLSSRDALLWFSWDANGTCTLLETAVFASMKPKVH